MIDKYCLGWSTLYTLHYGLHTLVYTNYRPEDGYDRCGLLISDLALALSDVCSVTLHNNYCEGGGGAFKQESRRYVLICNLRSGQGSVNH